MKIAVGAMLYEGNTFARGETGLAAFQSNYLFEGAEILERLIDGDVEVSGALKVLQASGATIVPLIATHGGCGGKLVAGCFEELCSRLLSRMDCDVDGVYLALHGAMVCADEPEPEVALMQRIRELVGSVPIVVTLDLHAHITPKLLSLCDAIVGYQHYPHDDAFETGVRGASLLLQSLGGRARLTSRMRKLSLLVPPTTAGTRLPTPMREMYRQCRSLEGLPGILAVSYFPSTPWAERPDGGTAFVVVTDGTAVDVETHLEKLCTVLWRSRSRFQPDVHLLEDVISLTAHDIAGPVIVSEMSDAVGAGAAGDSAYILEKFKHSAVQTPVLIQIVDPEVSALARRYGVGSRISCVIGNKVENRYGEPVELTAEVLSFFDGAFTYSGGLMSGIRATVGPSAVIRARNITILVTDRPAYEYADEQYAAAGLNVREFQYVVVKNPMNFQQVYAWAPKRFGLDTPGAGRADLTKLEWESCQRPFYPLDDSEEAIYRST
ncbi:M81 family metallopeptidase [Ottowia thiooxydans]|uniref:M81 family metallopeptidase n=1 Tax=Ottowia thiooxydans TaxID=219182 RepID=UPI000401F9E0|nr:M81 family metallopeptidase [Ottowia thiooxydans]